MKRYSKNYAKKTSGYQTFNQRKYAKKTRNRVLFTLITTLFLGYALLAWILPGLIGQLTILNRNKKGSTTETPITNSTTLAPPVLNIPYEATNTASIDIKGYASAHTKVEVYVDDTLSQTADVGDDGSFIAHGVALTLGTNNITGKTVGSDNTKSLPSKSIRVIFDNQKPKLDISSPSDNQIIKGGDKKVTVSGATNPGDNVSINGALVIVDSNGNFNKTIDINDGDNTITIQTTDKAGNQTTVSRKVTYQNS